MRVASVLFCVSLGACAQVSSLWPLGQATGPLDATEATPAPAAGAEGGSDISPLPISGQSVASFDTTTAEEREAAAKPASGGGLIGQTVAGLGDPTRPGIWLETPLVQTEQPGRVVLASTGASAQVTLIPLAAEATAGSRLSLAAMRVLEAPLSDLVEIRVFSGS